MSSARLHRLPRAAASVFALVVLLAGVPVALAAIATARFRAPHPLAGATPPWSWSLSDVESGLRDPLDDQTVIDVVLRSALVVAWLGVALIAASVVTEVVHQIRHRGIRSPHVRGLGWAQAAARWIVTGLIVFPTLSQSPLRLAALEPADVAVAPAAQVDELSTPWNGAFLPATPAEETRDADRAAESGVHVVRRGESVYGIASTLVDGDDRRTVEMAHEILDLNLGRVMADGQTFSNPAYIEIGWHLRLPHGVADPAPRPAPAARPTVHEVAPGESLSSIARTHFGNEAEWVTIWDANYGRTMDDGRVFDDPDLILPGWRLEIPAPDETVTTPQPPPPADHHPTELPHDTTAPDETVTTPQPPPPADHHPTELPHDTTAHGSEAADREVAASTIEAVPAPAPSTVPAAADVVTDAVGSAGVASEHTPDDETAPAGEEVAPRLDGTVGLERAALLSAGIVALAATVRLHRMRSAGVGARLPEPSAEVTTLHRRLLHDPVAERQVRLAAALRAVAARVTANREPGAPGDPPRIAVVRLSQGGDVAVTLTAEFALGAPWEGGRGEWSLPAEVPVDSIAGDARRAGDPCHALVSIGCTPAGDDLYIDLEAAGVLHVGGGEESAENVLRAVATSLAVAGHAEACHLVVGESVLVELDNPNAHVAESVDSGVELAIGLVGATRRQELTTFELRSRRTGGDIWEPAVLLFDLGPTGAGADWPADTAGLFAPAHGLALVTTHVPPGAADAWSLAPGPDGWLLSTTVGDFRVEPVGLDRAETAVLGALMETARRAPIEDELVWEEDADHAPFAEPDHSIVVALFGGTSVTSRDGTAASFRRSKSVELVSWLVTHRERATRTAARTALWDLDVRDATFANVVSEARRTLARLVAPPDGEWLARTLTEELPLDHRVVADADLVRARLEYARGVRDHAAAVEVLRPVLDLVADAPFAGTDYLWPDAEGITSNLVLLAVGACTELAQRALQIGDVDTLFAATDRGLRVLPGHEEMIALRMRAHARAGDTAGLRQEWESYERVILADPWSDGEPAPRLQAVRAELLGPA